MGVQVQPETPPVELNSETPPSDQLLPESTPPVTPPTNQPAAGVTDPRYIKLLEDTIKEQNRQIQEANTRASQTPPKVEPPAKSAEELRQEFYNNPHDALEENRRKIQAELRETVAPLLDFVNSMKGSSETDRLINQFKVDPRFAPMWDSALEGYVRQQAATLAPANLNENTFGYLVVAAVGMKATGMLPGATSTSTPPATPPATPPSPNMPTPPHMRPSAPPATPPSSGGPKLRTLTEHEERIRRENHMSVEQFIKFQEMPSSEVAFADFDKPKGGK